MQSTNKEIGYVLGGKTDGVDPLTTPIADGPFVNVISYFSFLWNLQLVSEGFKPNVFGNRRGKEKGNGA